MAKIDYQRYTLPDIEMYAGNTDVWEFPLYNSNMVPYNYEDVNGYTFRLIIDDYGYTRRQTVLSQNALVKTGVLARQDDDTALVRFELMKPETNTRFGKYTYQIEAEGAGKFFSAQGSLYIVKNMNQ